MKVGTEMAIHSHSFSDSILSNLKLHSLGANVCIRQ